MNKERFHKEISRIDFPKNEIFSAIDEGLKKGRKDKEVKRTKKSKKQWLGISAAAAVIALSISLTSNNGVIASIPFVGDVIEKYISTTETLDYASYKTAIGETAENEMGKLTLNEVMMDDKRLFLSATFEPADHVDFDYQTYLGPSVKINGENYSVETGGQSIELNSSMFTIYNNIVLSESIDTENLNIEISYDTLNRTTIEQPWTFDVDVLQAQLLEDKKVFEMNKTLTLTNGETVTIQQVVTTPISTTVYFDLSQSTTEDIRFRIQSENGKQERFNEAFTSNTLGDVSRIRFEGLTIEESKYYLVAYDSEGNQLSDIVPISNQ